MRLAWPALLSGDELAAEDDVGEEDGEVAARLRLPAEKEKLRCDIFRPRTTVTGSDLLQIIQAQPRIPRLNVRL